MLKAYFDASGTRETDAVFVAGLVSSMEQWLKFEEEWTAWLTQFGVPYFHMKEFTQSRGPFSEWQGDEKRRREFLSRLCGILSRRVRKSFSRGIMTVQFQPSAWVPGR